MLSPGSLNKILATVHPYPTWSEAAKYTAGAWKRAHAPAGLLPALEWFHGWRRRGDARADAAWAAQRKQAR